MPDIIGLARTFHAESDTHRDLPFDDITVHQLITAAIGSDDWLPLVAYASSGQIVGIGLFFAVPTFFGPATEAGDLVFYVEPSRRGGLVAARMVQELRKWCIAKGVQRYRQGVDTGINHQRAHDFFTGVGLVPCGALYEWRF